MKRLITFNTNNEKFTLIENDVECFSILKNDMKFDSFKFYEGIYKGKSPYIEFDYPKIFEASRMEKYVYNWLATIINSITAEFPEMPQTDDEIKSDLRVIPLYELPACAGNGLYTEGNIPASDFSTNNLNADYAIKISGESMEPTIPDGSIVLVKQITDPQDNDICIVNFNGESMCKRFVKLKKGAKLISDNKKSKFITIHNSQIACCKFEGKVIDIISQN